VERCKIERNGFARAALTVIGDQYVGAGIDSNGAGLRIIGCSILNNAYEFIINSGTTSISDCRIAHSSSLYQAVLVNKLTSESTLTLKNSRCSWAEAQKFIEIMAGGGQSVGGSLVAEGNEFTHNVSGQPIITATNGGNITLRNNLFRNCTFAVHLVATSGETIIENNIFRNYSTGVRIFASTNGVIRNNHFEDSNGTNCYFGTGSTGWKILNNTGYAGALMFQLEAGGTGSTIEGNVGYSNYSFKGNAGRIANNEIGNIFFANSGAANMTLSGNVISGTVSHTTANYGSNVWLGNRGAGVSGVFKGSGPLVAGTVTIPTAAAYVGKTIILSRRSANASTAIGSIAVGTITAGASFVINSLNAAASVETGDLSTVQWEILD